MVDHNWIDEGTFTLTEFLSPQECDDYIRLSEELGYDAAPINTAFGPQIRSDVRNNQRVMLDDPTRAQELWRRIQEFVPRVIADRQAVGVNERFRFYRYDVGQLFQWHFDGAFERANGDRSLLTFMVYLNDGFEGGETSFSECRVVPVRGMALLFLHQLRHKGEPVLRGRKYVLRTDVMYAAVRE
jgi:predicted 2-oxoglutarate/Fe(II)-dependent dioxygenase YbiX